MLRAWEVIVIQPHCPQAHLLTGKDLAFKVSLTLLNITNDKFLGHIWCSSLFYFILFYFILFYFILHYWEEKWIKPRKTPFRTKCFLWCQMPRGHSVLCLLCALSWAVRGWCRLLLTEDGEAGPIPSSARISFSHSDFILPWPITVPKILAV